MLGCRFLNNTAVLGGGAIECSLRAGPHLDGCRFEGNRAAWGGAVSARADSWPVINQCTFVGNVAEGVHGYGGAVYSDYESAPAVRFSTLTQNTARFGGAVAVFEDATLLVGNCSLVGNLADARGHAVYALDASPAIHRSIIAFQAGQPVNCEGRSQPMVFQTDIYGNDGQDWVGRLAELRELNGNFSADPVFCDASPHSLDLHLQATSPCAPENNSLGVLVGALEVGCGTTSVRLISFTADVVPDGVDVAWSVREEAADQEYRLEGQRLDSGGVTWIVAHEDQGGGTYHAQDRSEYVDLGGEITYLLWTRQNAGTWYLLDTRAVTIPTLDPVLSLLPAWPNPFNPATNLAFTLGRESRVRLRIHDVAGRVIRTVADQLFGPGNHSVTWDGHDLGGRPVPSGTYFVVMECEGQTLSHKLTMLK